MTPKRMAEIHQAAFRTQRTWSENEFTDLVSDPYVFAFTEDENCFALGRIIAGEAELLTIATHPDAQRQGHAASCMRNFIQHCTSSDCTQIFLEVDADNCAAIELYQAFNFSGSGRRKDYYRHPDGSRSDAIIMALESVT